MKPKRSGPILVRGAGDLASGVIVRLLNSGYSVVALEIAEPSAIRRSVAFSEAVYEGTWMVEGWTARLVSGQAECETLLEKRSELPLLVDPEAASLAWLKPRALVDAIVAKRNLGTRRGMAPLVLGLGPGFWAGEDVDLVLETNRGHDLGRLITQGPSEADTGLPGEIGGSSGDRVLRAPATGRLRSVATIGDKVGAGQLIAYIEGAVGNFNLCSKIDGILRGLIRDGYQVSEGLKIADVDPRGRSEHCRSISDKARALGGGVLEALLSSRILP